MADSADTIDGGEGNDLVINVGKDGLTLDLGTANVEAAYGNEAADRLTSSGNASVVIDGAGGDDVVGGGSGADRLFGGDGNDHVSGGAGSDLVWGDGGNDRLEGGAGADSLWGGAGDDTLSGGAGADMLDGGEGNDRFEADAEDIIHGGAGFDTVVFTGGPVAFDLGKAEVEAVTGTTGDDRFTGGAADEVIEGGAGADTISGGAGRDTASYAGSSTGVTVDLAAGTGMGGDAEGDSLSSIEDVTGSAHDDRLSGDVGANRLEGGAGDDILEGRGGADILLGGAGNDILIADADDLLHGGSGHDTVLFEGTQGAALDLSAHGIEAARGTGAADTLWSSAGQSGSVTGAGGDDRLGGSWGADRIEGGAGSDLLLGAGGDDTYVFGRGSGADRLLDADNQTFFTTGTAHRTTADTDAGQDTLSFGPGVRPEDVVLLRRGDDLLVGLREAGVPDGRFEDLADRLVVQDFFRDQNRIESFRFEDGTVLAPEALGIAGYLAEATDLSDHAVHAAAGPDEAALIRAAAEAGGNPAAGARPAPQSAPWATTPPAAGTVPEPEEIRHGAEGPMPTAPSAGAPPPAGSRPAMPEPAGEGAVPAPAAITGAGAAAPDDTAPVAPEGHPLRSGAGTASVGDAPTAPEVRTHGPAADAEGASPSGAAPSMPPGATEPAPDSGSIPLAPPPAWMSVPGAARDAAEGFPDEEEERRRSRAHDLRPPAARAADAAATELLTVAALAVVTGTAASAAAALPPPVPEGAALGEEGGEAAPPAGAGLDADALDQAARLAAERLAAIAAPSGDVPAEPEPLSGMDIPAPGMPAAPPSQAASLEGTGPAEAAPAPAPFLPPVPSGQMQTSAEATTDDRPAGIAASPAGDAEGTDGPEAVDGLIGTEGDDVFRLRPDQPLHTLQGLGGTDTVYLDYAGGGTLDLGAHTVEAVHGGAGTDMLFTTSAGPVRLHGRQGDDRLSGGAGDDLLVGGVGADRLDGGGGADTAGYADSAIGVRIDLVAGLGSGGDAEGDVLSGIEGLEGSAHSDTLLGDAGANRLSGGDGDDVLAGRQGADRLDGGGGRDRADYSESASGVAVDLASGIGSGGDAEGDRLSGIEDVTGSAHGDILTGDAGANALAGGAGDDVLVGRGGDDTLLGGSGDDLLEGGEGADRLDGGEGLDLAGYGNSAAGVSVDLAMGLGSGGEAEGDLLSGIEDLAGSMHGDRLAGDGGANDLSGGGGDDLLEGRGGADRLDGGAGRDRAIYEGSAAGVWIDLAAGSGSGGDASGDILADIEDVSGSSHADTLLGDAGGNVLSGGAGADHLDGRAGDDILLGGNGDDRFEGGKGADILEGGAGEDLASYAGSAAGILVDLVSGMGAGGDAEGDALSGIEHLEGSAHADRLSGDGGANLLMGGDGDDLLEGRAGADRLEGGSGRDGTVYAGSDAGVWIDLAGGFGRNGEAEGDVLDGIEDVSGSAHADTLLGDGGANALSGGAGDDLLEGRGGADRLDGGAGEDAASYAGSAVGVTVDLASGTGSGGDAHGDVLSGIEHLVGSGHDDRLSGDGGANALSGGGGDDLLIGGAGADRLDGGSGQDRADYAASHAGVAVDLAAGKGRFGDAEGDRLSGIEDVTGSGLGDALSGDAGANRLEGGAGDDRLEGRGGADILLGGDGIDLADYSGSAAGVTVDLAAGTGAGGDAEGDVLSGIEDLEGSDHADLLAGDDAGNQLAGADGDDRLSGGAGADRLDGGDGRDVASYAGSSAGVSVDLASGRGQGGDAEGDLLSGIEHIEGSAHADRLSGDTGANALSGGGGDDILSGGAGADRLEGGGGRDLADYGTSSGAVWIDLAAGQGHGADAEGDLLLGIEDLAGSAFADTLLGDAGANRIAGGAGDDWIEGGAGADVLDGGAGFDTVSYAGSAAGVSVDLAAGTAAGGDAAGDALLSVEGVVGTVLADTLAGDGAANLLSGGGGDDVLSGGAGADRLEGGAGRDRAVYLGSMAGVRVDLAAGAGAGGDAEGDVLSGIEDLAGSALADTLAGDGGANRIEGRAGNDRLEGRGGDDILQGGDGDDLLLGGTGADRLEGGSGTDRAGYEGSAAGVRVDLAAGLGSGGDAEGDVLTGIEELAGSGHADTLLGDGGANRLDGGAGDDILAGGGGADRLDGGAGRDRADYAASLAGVWVDLGAGRGVWGDAEGDVLTGIEDVSGSAHADVLTGDGGSNALVGGGGDDVLSGGAGADTLDGGAGIDTAAYALAGSGVSVDLAAGRGLAGDALGDVLSGVENLTGSAFADVLRGDAGDNLIEGGGGADTIDGGAGFDTTSYAGAAGGVSVDLGTGRGTAGEAAGDVLTGIEAVRGSAWGDTLLGGAGADRLDGAAGADLLLGGAGADTLLGGDGDDRLWGEAGDDLIEGGAGWDGAEYSGNANGYAIQRLGLGAAIVTDLSAANGWEGRDTLTGVEYLRFADRVVHLDGTNNAPVAGADGGIATDEDSPVVISSTSLLANDFDYDGNALSIAWVGDAWGGAVALNAAGNVVFTPHANHHGDAGFSYLADDGRGGQARASVQVAVRPVNDAPVAAGESFSTRNDTALTLSQATLLANDRDPDGDPLGVASVGGAVGGTVTINAAGNIVFTPLASHVGAGGFWYTAADGKGGSDSAWVPVEMTPSNRAPVIVGYAPNSHFSSVKDGYLVYDTLTFYDPDQDSRSLTYQVGAAWAWGGGHSGGGDAEIPAYVQTSISYDDRGFGYLHLLNQGKFNITVTIRDSGGLSTSYTYWSPPPPVDSKPIVLDLDGDGLELVALAESAARFDMDGDGTRDRTGWVAADDALLVFDADGDRRASGRDEIVIADHGLPGMTDLEALAHAFDSDANRVFDARDERWSSFGVWQDLDQDGEADDGEYRTLDEAGITSIGLDRAGGPRDIEGNTIYGEARFATVSGDTGAVGDVALAYVPSPASTEAGLNRLTEAMVLFDAAGMGEAVADMPPDVLWTDQADPAGEDQGGRIFLAVA